MLLQNLPDEVLTNIMWKFLHVWWFLQIYVSGKAAGYYYQRLKSREGNDCPPRLSPKVYKRFCSKKNTCQNDKDCTKAGEVCICDEDCGRLCANPTSTCTSGWCQNGGLCKIINGRANCSCPSNFTGDRCETDVDECVTLAAPCLNGGTCTNHFGGYICRCVHGWEGYDCSQNFDDCKREDGFPRCQYNGTCKDLVGTYKCICPPEKTGLICQFDNKCYYNNTCKGSSRCITGPFGTAECVCPSGYTGADCTIDIIDCDGLSPCYHGSTCMDIPGGYKCDCVSGYTGTRCDLNINECASSPCVRGHCLDYPNKFVCICPAGYEGIKCDKQINECQSSPCKNSAQCVDKINSYKCKCRLGYNGVNCERNIDDCARNPCLNNGTCQDLLMDYKCVCPLGFEGDDCEINKDDCKGLPCRNGGRCVDGANDYSCTCQSGFIGKNCEIDVDECASSPCHNGGTCRDKINGYTCKCPAGTYGERCESNTNDCTPDVCKNSGICQDGMNSFSCRCQPGFTGQTCETNVNECSSSPCLHGGTCADGIAQYYCHCTDGYTGDRCEKKKDSCLNNYCQNGATCEPLASNNGYKCRCLPGYTGLYCDKNIDDCVLSPCQNGRCIDGINGYTCDCFPGFTGSDCNINVDDCQSSPCFHGATCQDGQNSFLCKCPPGFRGMRCEHHINECDSLPCLNGATCVDMIGNYSCYCPTGYTGRNCGMVVQWCDNNPCQNGGTCGQTGIDFKCNCRSRYTGVICDIERLSCSDAQSKAGSGVVCKNGGTCTDVDRIQSCTCPKGYTGSYCEIDINECATGPCKNGATCRDQVGNYMCQCMKGFTGKNCEINVNDCTSNPCQNNGRCTDLVNGYICSCRTGWVGKNCSVNPNDCFQNTCFYGGTCVDGLARFDCKCPPGYAGVRCEKEIDECASNPCRVYHTEKCINRVNSYYCKCKRGFQGVNCETDVNECLSYPCRNSGTCIDGAGKYTCMCPKGYSGINCERRVRGCRDHPCFHNATCTGVLGTYNCICQPGVEGLHCEMNKDDCRSVPCGNGGTCVDGYNSYTCKCLNGYSGSNCQQNVNECLSNPCKNGGTCQDHVDGYKCDCLPGLFTGKHCESHMPEKCPYDDCTTQFDGGPCKRKCNIHSCGWDGTDCSLGVKPWGNCSKLTHSGRPCYSVFDDDQCNRECNTPNCLHDGYDCKPQEGVCPINSYCAPRFMDGHCDPACNTKQCILDGLDCDTRNPDLFEDTLVMVLLVTPESFRNGSQEFLRQLSRVLRTIAVIRKDDDGNPIIKVKDLSKKTGAITSRSKREAEIGWLFFRKLRHRSRRANWASVGSEVHVKLDKRGCSDLVCLDPEAAARFLGAKASSSKLDLPYDVYSVKSKKDEGPTPITSTFDPLWIAMLCVGIPLFVVGVLAGGKRVYARLWVPEGFMRRNNRQRRSFRREPVGQEVTMRNVGKSASELEVGAAGEDRLGLTPPQDGRHPKRVRLHEGPGKLHLEEKGGVDNRQWTQLHREAADVNVRNSTALLALTPPQEGDHRRGVAAYEVNAKGPGGFTALHLAACRGTLVDGCSIDDDSNSDDSGGAMVSDLLSLGAKSSCETDDEKETPLHLAARYSRADAAKRLLDAGADANARNKSGRTPLHQAVGADAQGVFQILLRNRATELEAKDNDGTTPIILAARSEMLDMVKELIKANAKVNNADHQGKTALHWAAAVNSLNVTKELLRSGAKKDQQDDKGQTPLFLGAREGSYETVRCLLLNFANRKIADNMDQTPEDIARQRLHGDIVELLTDWSLGCSSPIAAAPTSPMEGQNSPMTCTQSPPPIEARPTGNGTVVTHFPVCAPPKSKTTSSAVAKGARAKTTVAVAGAKRKRKKQPRMSDQNYTGDFNGVSIANRQSGVVLSPSSMTNGLSPASTGASFSPPAMAMMNGLSPQDSMGGGISPSNSTTLSPPKPNSLATNSPSPPMLEPHLEQHQLDALGADRHLDVLGPDLGLEDISVDGNDFFDEINFDQDNLPHGEFVPPVATVYDASSVSNLQDPLSVSCQMLPVTAIGQNINGVGQIVPTTSDCMYVPNSNQRRENANYQRLYSAASSPNLPCTVDTLSTLSLQQNPMQTVQKSCTTSPSQMAAFQAISNSNAVEVVSPTRKDRHRLLLNNAQHTQFNGQLQFTGSEKYPTPPSGHSYGTSYDSSPQKLPNPYLTPSPDSPERWSSSSSPHSSNSDWSNC